MQCSSDGDNDRELRPIRWIQIEEEIVRMLKVGKAIGPRIMVDATKASQKEKRSAIGGGRVMNYLTAMLGIHRNRLEPLRQTFAHVLLKKSLSPDSVGVTSQNQSPIAEKRQDEVGHAVVVSEHVPLGVAGFGKIDFV